MMSHKLSYRIASHWETFIRLQEANAQEHTAVDLHGFSTALLQQGLHRLPIEP